MSFAESVPEVAELLDSLSIGNFYVTGHSRGGVHAMMIAASPALSQDLNGENKLLLRREHQLLSASRDRSRGLRVYLGQRIFCSVRGDGFMATGAHRVARSAI